MIRRIFIAAALAALFTSLAPAQRGGGGGGGGQMGGGGGGFGRGARADKSAVFTELLKLSPDQKTAIEAIMDDAQKQADSILPQIVTAKRTMLDLSVQGREADEATKQLAALNAQMLSVEAGAFGQALAKLDDKQKKNAPKMFDLMGGMFTAPGGWRKSN
jgi:Spy/CpxP family protein refolding chaperone